MLKCLELALAVLSGVSAVRHLFPDALPLLLAVLTLFALPWAAGLYAAYLLWVWNLFI